MTTKTQTHAAPSLLEVLRSARADLKALFERGIDLAEKRSKKAFRFARNVAKRIGGGAAKRK